MKKKSSCIISKIWPSAEDMDKELFIDLENQQIIKLSTKKILKQRLDKEGYTIINFVFNGMSRNLKLHRLFFYHHHRFLPRLVDHKDTNKSNNHIENLRDLTKSENAMNSNKRKLYNNKPTSSIYKGVSWKKRVRKWQVSLTHKGKHFRLGLFNNEHDAGQAYNDKIRELGLEEVSVLNDTPQERARGNQFNPLPQEINNIKVLFQDIETLVDLK